jgi:hypothetical protein
MYRRTATLLAWTLCSFCIALVALMGLLHYLTPEIPEGRMPLPLLLLNWVLWLAYPTIGALITTHRPQNSIGWIFLVAVPLYLIPEFAAVYTDYAMSTRLHPLPSTLYTAWLGDSGIALPSIMVIMALLLSTFPNGRLLSRNWRVVPWSAVVGGTLVTVYTVTLPGPVYTYRSFDNPFGIEGAKAVLEVLGKVGLALLLVSWVIAAISLMVRREEASRVERQQIRWFAFSLLLIILALPFAFWSVGPAVVALLPIATAIAIFRYRLYDIDRIINRTLVYGSLTAMLAAVYFGGVTTTQATSKGTPARRSFRSSSLWARPSLSPRSSPL